LAHAIFIPKIAGEKMQFSPTLSLTMNRWSRIAIFVFPFAYPESLNAAFSDSALAI
jgi:hypothetical protein